jgi:hypothetical protein
LIVRLAAALATSGSVGGSVIASYTDLPTTPQVIFLAAAMVLTLVAGGMPEIVETKKP